MISEHTQLRLFFAFVALMIGFLIGVTVQGIFTNRCEAREKELRQMNLEDGARCTARVIDATSVSVSLADGLKLCAERCER